MKSNQIKKLNKNPYRCGCPVFSNDLGAVSFSLISPVAVRVLFSCALCVLEGIAMISQVHADETGCFIEESKTYTRNQLHQVSPSFGEESLTLLQDLFDVMRDKFTY